MLLLYWNIPARFQWIVLLVASIIFYIFNAPIYTFVYIGISLVSVYFAIRYFDIPMTSFDEYSNLDKEAVFGKTTVLNLYRRSKLHSENIFKDKDKIIIKENILENIISLAKEKKNTKFYLYFTPYSVLYWDDLIRRGDLDRTLETLKIVIKDLLEVDNIRLYYFSNNTEITTNFDNYKDTVHYGEWVNSYIIKAISKGENLLIKDNYMDYLNKTREIYTNYDYKSLLNSNY